MANVCEQYCADVVEALLADYNTNPECPMVFMSREDLGPTRMECSDLSLTVSVQNWKTWSDGGVYFEAPLNDAGVLPDFDDPIQLLPSIRITGDFSLLVIYHAVSAADHGEGWWNAQGLVAALSSWLTWRRIGQSERVTRDVEVRNHFERDGSWSGWLLVWEDELVVPARFEYHCPDGVFEIGPEPADDLSELITGQMLGLGNLDPSDSPEFKEVDGDGS